jgi:hypothetical protein
MKLLRRFSSAGLQVGLGMASLESRDMGQTAHHKQAIELRAVEGFLAIDKRTPLNIDK